MSTPDILFILTFVLAIVIAIVFSLVSVFIYKREQVIKNPYYHCSTKWQCCAPGNPDCDKSGPTGITGTAKVADNWKQGSNYHQNCVLPVQNAILNYSKTPGASFHFDYLYTGGEIPSTNPSVYYPGCTGPGGVGDCANPELNPQYEVGSTGLVCPFISFDAPAASYVSNNGALPSGADNYSGNNGTLNNSNWGGNPASPYIAGTNGGSLTTPGNNYIFPYQTKQAQKGQYTGGPGNGFTNGNSWKNTFYSSLSGGGRFPPTN